MAIGDECDPAIAQSLRLRLLFQGTGIRNGQSVLDVQIALTIIIENAKRGVAPLLNLHENNSRANCMNCSGGDRVNIALMDGAPLYHSDDRAVIDGGTQFCRRNQTPQSDGDYCIGHC